MPPLINLVVDFDRFRAARMLPDDNLCAAFVELANDGVAVEGFVGDQSTELDAFDERCDSNGRLEPAHENPRSCPYHQRRAGASRVARRSARRRISPAATPQARR